MNILLLSESGGLIELISQPWHWSVSGIAIAIILFLLTWMGRSLGISSSYENFCTIAGAGKKYELFNTDIKNSYWRLLFLFGVVCGGYIAANFLQSPEAVAISSDTIAALKNWGWDYPKESGDGFLPTNIFNLSNPLGITMAIIGGFLIGFGARYGKGCTSGHAITGLSHLQLPSLITVIGFFIGGLTMVWLILPLIFG